MFAVVEPACARSWSEFFGETTAGGIIGGLLGAGAVILTGGAALPLVAGGAALGAAVGATPEDKRPEVITGTIAGGAAAVIVDGMKHTPQP